MDRCAPSKCHGGADLEREQQLPDLQRPCPLLDFHAFGVVLLGLGVRVASISPAARQWVLRWFLHVNGTVERPDVLSKYLMPGGGGGIN